MILERRKYILGTSCGVCFCEFPKIEDHDDHYISKKSKCIPFLKLYVLYRFIVLIYSFDSMRLLSVLFLRSSGVSYVLNLSPVKQTNNLLGAVNAFLTQAPTGGTRRWSGDECIGFFLAFQHA